MSWVGGLLLPWLLCAAAIGEPVPSVPSVRTIADTVRQVDDVRWVDGKYQLTGHQPSFVKVWPQGQPEQQLEFSFNTDATQVTIHAPSDAKNREPVTKSPLRMLLAEKSVVHPDGVVVLSALDAEVVGNQAKLETHPGSHRIGYWNKASDYVVWDFATPPGEYQAELVYSRAPRTGTKVTIAIGEKKFPLALETTGSWYRYRTIPLGPVAVEGKGKTRVEVRVDKIINGGVMNLKAVVLMPKAWKEPQAAAQTVKPSGATVSYSDDIRPILSDRCFLCHGPDEASRQADLRLDLREEAISWAIVPGDAENSEVVSRVLSEEAEVQMPPPEAHKPQLTASEVEILKRWINEGAVYEQHWAFVPPERPTPPQVSRDAWRANPIDRFVLAKLEAEGIEPASRTDKRTLLRRASLDLIGLPPTRDQIEEFMADTSPDAWPRAIDRLLASPAYGEHQARYWLDVARYADSNGYQYDFKRDQWVWRDWVIAALNANMPFDQFTIEQLAGDLLPGATPHQRLATGFNRNHPITVEGGIIDEEYRVEYVLDRTTTAGSAWMGLTLGCARCHTHKYDPISQKEFYELSAFFNQVPERGMRGFTPREKIPSPLQIREVADAEQAVASAEARFRASYAAWSPDPTVVQQELHAATDQGWRDVQVRSAKSLGRAKMTTLEDNSIELSGENPDNDTYEITIEADGKPIDAIRLEVLPSDADGGKPRVGRSPNGNFVLSEVGLEVSTKEQPSIFEQAGFRAAYADYSQQGFDVRNAVDGEIDSRGWAVFGRPGSTEEPRAAAFVPERSISPRKRARLKLTLRFKSIYRDHQIARFRISLAQTDKPARALGAKGAQMAEKPALSSELALAEWITQIKGEGQVRQDYDRLIAARMKLDKLLAAIPTTMVMQDLDEPRGAYVLERGEYDKRRERVQPGTPAALPPMPADLPRNRLGFAQWLTMPSHPLTSRVTVNRLWIQLFGLGIVNTPEDFGLQSSPPSHPELLDWLAVEFVESGWDVKRLLKTIMLSQTYQQSSAVTAEQHAADPVNRLLARGPRIRLDAETIRDSALAVSGLLNRKLGGPSVFPYHPKGLWLEINNRPGYSSKYEQDSGDKLYRRGLYTFWKRTVPPPSMAVFDAPSREYCQVSRSRTNTPLQAFVLLHDPQFVEAARALAERMLTEGGGALRQQVEFGFELALGRLPTTAELEQMIAAYQEELAAFEQSPEKAERLLAIGESPRNEQLSSSRHAAMTNVARLILNLSEFVTKG